VKRLAQGPGAIKLRCKVLAVMFDLHTKQLKPAFTQFLNQAKATRLLPESLSNCSLKDAAAALLAENSSSGKQWTVFSLLAGAFVLKVNLFIILSERCAPMSFRSSPHYSPQMVLSILWFDQQRTIPVSQFFVMLHLLHCITSH
jgi:hypothetical protein